MAMKVVRQARLELSGGSTPDQLRPPRGGGGGAGGTVARSGGGGGEAPQGRGAVGGWLFIPIVPGVLSSSTDSRSPDGRAAFEHALPVP